VLPATLASPQFVTNDYGSTTAATNGGFARGAGGALSQGDSGNLLQLQDATMRAQFNQIGASNYHLLLHPNVLPAVTINIPSNQGTLLQSGRGSSSPRSTSTGGSQRSRAWRQRPIRPTCRST
jgi:hypothetical protein